MGLSTASVPASPSGDAPTDLFGGGGSGSGSGSVASLATAAAGSPADSTVAVLALSAKNAELHLAHSRAVATLTEQAAALAALQTAHDALRHRLEVLTNATTAAAAGGSESGDAGHAAAVFAELSSSLPSLLHVAMLRREAEASRPPRTPSPLVSTRGAPPQPPWMNEVTRQLGDLVAANALLTAQLSGKDAAVQALLSEMAQRAVVEGGDGSPRAATPRGRSTGEGGDAAALAEAKQAAAASQLALGRTRAELAGTKAELVSRLSAAQAEVTAMKANAEGLRRELESTQARLAEVEKRAEAAATSGVTSGVTTDAELRASINAAIAEVEARHRSDLATGRTQTEAALGRLAEDYQRQLSQVLRELQQKDALVMQLQAATEDASTRTRVEVDRRLAAEATLERRSREYDAETVRLQSQLKELKASAAASQAQLATATSEAVSSLVATVETRLREEHVRERRHADEAWRAKVAFLERELAAAREQGEDARAKAASLEQAMATRALEQQRSDAAAQLRIAEALAQAQQLVADEKAASQRAVSDLRNALEAGVERSRSEHAAEAAAWAATKVALETRLQEMTAKMASTMQARDDAAMAALDQLHTDVMSRHGRDVDSLKKAHAAEVERLISSAQRTMEAERRAWEEVTEARVAAARKAAEDEAAHLREAALTESLSAARAQLESAMREAHDQHEAALDEERQAAGEAMSKVLRELEETRATSASRIAGLEASLASSMPLDAVHRLAAEAEARAGAALTAAVSEAVNKVVADSEAVMGGLTTVLREREGQVAELQGELHATVSRAAKEVERASELAAQAGMEAADAWATLQQRTLPAAMAAQAAEIKSAMHSALHAQLEGARQEMDDLLAAQRAAHDRDTEAARQRSAEERSTLQQECMRLGTLLDDARKDVARRDERIMAMLRDADDKAAAATADKAAALAAQAAGLAAGWASEREALEAAANTAIQAAVAEAMTTCAAAHKSELDALQVQFSARMAAAEREAAADKDRALSARDAAHRAQLDAAFAQALQQRDASVRALLEEKATALADADARHRAAMAAAAQQNDDALRSARINFEAEKRALAEAAAADIAKALAATQTEMQAALTAAEAAWSSRVTALMAQSDADHAAALQMLAAQADAELERVREGAERAAMGNEEARQALLAAHEQAVADVVARGIAEAEAETVAALGVFNSEWLARMQKRTEEMEAAKAAAVAAAETAAAAAAERLRLQMEADRAAAVEAVMRDADADRQALTADLQAQAAAALAAADARHADALRSAAAAAASEQDRALAAAAAASAAERAAAIDAVRQQANVEHEAALEALRTEADRLLANIEGAMTKLKEERDHARGVATKADAKAKAAEERVRSMRASLQSTQQRGALLRVQSLLLAAMYATMVKRVNADHAAQRDRLVREAATELAAKKDELEAALGEERWKVQALSALRQKIVDTLTGFKRDTVMEHKVKTMELAKEIGTLADSQSELMRQQSALAAQLAELEGSVRAIERDMAEIAKTGIISEDGTVNMGITRKKKRLDRDLDAAIARLADRRTALEEVKRKMAAVEEQRSGREEALRAVEADLITTLVQQQRSLMAIIATSGTEFSAGPAGAMATGTLDAGISVGGLSPTASRVHGAAPASPQGSPTGTAGTGNGIAGTGPARLAPSGAAPHPAPAPAAPSQPSRTAAPAATAARRGSTGLPAPAPAPAPGPSAPSAAGKRGPTAPRGSGGGAESGKVDSGVRRSDPLAADDDDERYSDDGIVV